MKKFIVDVSVMGSTSVTVEAENEADALEKAQEMVGNNIDEGKIDDIDFGDGIEAIDVNEIKKPKIK